MKTAVLNNVFFPPLILGNNHSTRIKSIKEYTVYWKNNLEFLWKLCAAIANALRIGLSLNPSKCQLLAIHGILPVSLSSIVTPTQACTCEFCAQAIGHPVNYEALHPPLTPLPSAKYLGSHITPTSSSVPDVIFRCSHASTAFKQLEPFLRHPLISPKHKLRTYSTIVQSILLHGMESQTLSPAQVSKVDSLHYKALRQIFHIKSPYYHRVIQPSDASCSNEYLQSLSYQVLPSVIPNSHRISDLRMKYLGHILRHPLSFEYSLMFNPSGTLRTLSSPYRRGAPRAHWPELALAEAQFKISTRRNSIPPLGSLYHPFYTLFTISDLKALRGANMPNWIFTTLQIQMIFPIAYEREQWSLLYPKKK